MIPVDRYPLVHPWDTLGHAVSVMVEAELLVGGQRSLPRVLLVLEKDGGLAGILRRRDIMRGLEPRFLVTQAMDYRKKLFDVAVDPNLAELPFDRVVHGIREQAGRPVRDVMRPVTATIDPEAHIMKAISEMVALNQSLIPVVQGGHVLGVIRSVDVFRELARLLH